HTSRPPPTRRFRGCGPNRATPRATSTTAITTAAMMNSTQAGTVTGPAKGPAGSSTDGGQPPGRSGVSVLIESIEVGRHVAGFGFGQGHGRHAGGGQQRWRIAHKGGHDLG